MAPHTAPLVRIFALNNKHHKNCIEMPHFPSKWPHPKTKWLQIPDCLSLEGLLMTDEKFEQLRAWWRLCFKDVMAPALEVLPPMRGVNHRINMIDHNARHVTQHATCPQALEDQLRDKMAHYEQAEWWVRRPVPTACLLMCIAKKDGSLRTVIDMHKRNANTVLDVTPMPDMCYLMDCMVHCKYHSKIDMTDAYEEIRIKPDCIQHTGFSMPYGTFESNIMQQGDCNAPLTFQCVLTWVLRD